MLFSKCNIYMKNNESLQQDVGVVHALLYFDCCITIVVSYYHCSNLLIPCDVESNELVLRVTPEDIEMSFILISQAWKNLD